MLQRTDTAPPPREPITARGGRNLIPRVCIRTCVDDDPTFHDDADYSGRVFVVSWLGWLFEIALSRREA